MGTKGSFWASSSLGSLLPNLPSRIRRREASHADIPPVPDPTAWK